MIQPRQYNTTNFRPKQQCNAILVDIVCVLTIGNIIDCQDTYEKVRVFSYFLAFFAIFGLVNATLINL